MTAIVGRTSSSSWRWLRALTRQALRVRRWFWLRDPRLPVHHLGGISLVVLPGVFDGVRLRSGAYLALTLAAQGAPAGSCVLDLGTGSGIGAIIAARWARRVVATDINPEAIRCARINALINHCEQVIETRVGDLFGPIGDERFDLILLNPPFYSGQPCSAADQAWRSPDMFDRFLRELPAHLRAGGQALIVLSSDSDIAPALGAASHLQVSVVRRTDLINEILTIYDIRVAEPTGPGGKER